jgi:hypothetical protein
MNSSRAMPTPRYYQNIDTGETLPVLQWAMSYTLYQQADGTLRGYTRAGGSQPPITLRHVDTPPSETPGPHMAPVESVQNPQFIEFMQNRLRRRPTFLAESLLGGNTAQFDALRRELRSVGLNLQRTGRVPETWVSTRTETLGEYTLEMLVSPDFYSGYDSDPYQQVIGGLGEAGINAEGIGIVLTGPEQQRASTIAFRGTSFEQQTEFFNDAVSAASRYLNPNLSYRNLGTVVGQSPFSQDGRPWKPGDLVNISRSSQDGGGLATAHVVRIYPTQVQVVWPNDADHPVENFPRGWYSLEDKSDLIFIREDPEWLAQWRSKPRNLSSAFGSEGEATTGSNILTTSLYPYGIGTPTDGPSPRSLAGDFAQSPYSDPERFVESQTEGPSPVWTSQVSMPDFLMMRTSPVRSTGDLYGQHDELMLHIRKQNALAALTGVRMPFE